ncbi:hypothetical protein PHMEG_00028851 [Phytophthora megakarya]|uniref:Uncharacterized protein n=1 Tax=Phytophthora megakarya TaxID=4795 RepID=A0A225V403_9STRA|nr:hypothetical protein PHMEG_00028851 [Phytophthora megakarya]
MINPSTKIYTFDRRSMASLVATLKELFETGCYPKILG